MGSLVLLDLMGGVALLLWGTHMVLTGVLRAFGPNLRRFLDEALRSRFTAFVAGLGLTALLQHDGERRHQADKAVGRQRGGHQPGRGARLCSAPMSARR